MPALALGQSNQVIGQETDVQGCKKMAGLVFVRCNQENRSRRFDEALRIQRIVMGTDQLLQFHVNKFQQLGQRRLMMLRVVRMSALVVVAT